ncbi:MAG: M42 family peptidase [candidate division WOR-3 bacterium]
MIEEIEKLSSLFGPSGKEEEVREYIKNSISHYSDEIHEDILGNLYVKKGKGKPRVLLCSHMDEVGFIIKEIDEKGYLKFSPIGGIEPETVIGKRIIFENKRKGVIGYKPIHLQDKEEKEKKISFDELVIDVGMEKGKVKKFFYKGMYAVFDTSFGKLNKKFYKGKAFDDRIGCAILIEIIKNFKPDFELFFLFSSQEEVGLRGAKIGAEKIKPDIGLVIECTAASDFYREDKEDFPALCKGPVLTTVDKSCIVDFEILEIIKNIAKKENIPFQYKKPLIGGTDAGNIQIAGKGVKIGIVSVPARYIHSPVSIINEEDLKNTYFLCLKFLKEIKRWMKF